VPAGQSKRRVRIRGRSIPAPRPTAWAGIVFVLRYGIPVVALGAAIDVLLVLLRAA
jgi:hypothetical protein